MAGPSQASPTKRMMQLSLLCLAMMGVGVAGAAPMPATVPPNATGAYIMSECMAVLGGGATNNSQGIFPAAKVEGCGGQLKEYLDSGAYLRGVEVAASSAYAPLGLPLSPEQAKGQRARRAKQLVVFDIDETLLSNVLLNPEFFLMAAGRRLMSLDSRRATPGVPPALKPMRAVYKAVCAAGHPIALITGRREPKRASTLAELKKEGYGAPCNGTQKSADAAGACCFMLVMRAADDNRLASVNKPLERAALMKKHGYEAYAGFGDQFSDLSGAPQFQYAFKLPNPFYTVL